jgi:hypothetical protein|tara:strand:- start:206 stop:355 length:150 start_codon:yes stop_codon:yes gene_type:complete
MFKRYIIKKLKEIIMVAREYEIDKDSHKDGYDYLIKDVENLLKEIQQKG